MDPVQQPAATSMTVEATQQEAQKDQEVSRLRGGGCCTDILA
jgi:hypothetical protein